MQDADRASVVNFTREAIAFRKTSAALRGGDFISREAHDSLLVFERATDDQRVLCIFNLGDAPTTLAADGAKLQIFSVGGAKLNGAMAEMSAFSALIIAL